MFQFAIHQTLLPLKGKTVFVEETGRKPKLWKGVLSGWRIYPPLELSGRVQVFLLIQLPTQDVSDPIQFQIGDFGLLVIDDNLAELVLHEGKTRLTFPHTIGE